MRGFATSSNRYAQSGSYINRFHFLTAMTILLALLLVLRLAYLQLAQYKRYTTLSLKNQMTLIPIAPTRGIIVDRNGIILAKNTPVYTLEVIPEHAKNILQTISKLQEILPSITDDDIAAFYQLKKQSRAYQPIPLKVKLSNEEVAIFASQQYLYPGVQVKARLIREYPFGELTAHLLGYVGRINAADLQNVSITNYRATNFIGKTGVEKFYESDLHGIVGYQQAETNASGKVIRLISKQPAIAGKQIQLALDIELQKAATKALDGLRGSVVVLKIPSGDILAMASSPSFDPNLFVRGISYKDYQSLITAKDNPLFNRAVRGLYPPASTIKPFLALKGLDLGIIDENTKVYDPGWFRLPGVAHTYHDWKRSGHGFVNLKRALTVSCDTYFYHLGYKIGIGEISSTLYQFGFGNKVALDLTDELPGIVPTPEWKKNIKKVNWYTGDTIISAIGQGFTLATPLQLANATAILAARGDMYPPHIKKTVSEIKSQPKFILNNQTHWDTIKRAMEYVISSKEGTGFRFGKTTSYKVAAKTGTAQVFGGDKYVKSSYKNIPERLRDHSLFIGFAPSDKPEIAVAVMLENHYVASNIARKVMDTYFNQSKQKIS